MSSPAPKVRSLFVRLRRAVIGPLVLVVLLTLGFQSSARAQANVTGQWNTLPTQMPINPVHVALMHTGKVLIVSGSGNYPSDTNYMAAVWDPATDTVTTIPVTWDMFCNGMTILPDGRPLVLGGTLQYDPFHGEPRVSAFDPLTENFVDLQPMAHGRWYPSATTLNDGRVIVFSGLDENGNTNQAVEIYKVGSGWSQQYIAPFDPPLYPRLHVLPNGNVVDTGSATTTEMFVPSTQAWTAIANTNYSSYRTYGTSVLLPLTPANNYDPRVIIMGGGNPATATTELIDLGAASPSWVYGPSMSEARIEMDAVILPNGKVLAVNGSLNDEDSTTASFNADLYDPTSNTFSSAGANAYPRLYHSGALLLPDATVLDLGGNPERGTYQPQMEIYSPAYLFNPDGSLATRPTITSVTPGVIGYNASFQIQTPNAANISSAVLIKAGSPTHAFDMDQRMVALTFSAGSGVLNAVSPPNSSIAPPGYYLLFILNSSGVPSVAQFVQLSQTPNDQPPTGSITSPSNNVTISVGQSVSFAGSGTSASSSIASYSWVFPGGNPASSTLANPGAVTFSTAGTYVVSLTVTDALGSTDPSPPIRIITVSGGPVITSPNSATFTVGTAGSFTVTATGTPAPALTESGALPSSVTFVDNGNGTATISGTPASGTAGSYPITITANDGLGTPGTQSFTLGVSSASGAPVIMSANNTTFTVGTAGTFTVTTTGSTTPALSESGSLPSVVTFKDNGNGTATISGTPGSGTAGSYPITITASNSAGTATQSFTLTVIPTSLVGWWKFEEGSGSTTADSSGNGNTMSLVNGVSWGAGEVGGAISANGTNQYGTVPAINLSNTSTVTVAFWANRTYSTTVESVMLEDSTNYNNSTTGFGFFPDDTQCLGIQAAVHGNVGYSVNCYTQPSSGVWHHLAIVYDKTQAGNNQTALYIDGVLQTPKSSLEAVQNTNSFGDNPIYLFSRDGSQFFNAGEVSDLRIYNVGLSAAQIQQLYQAGSATLVSIAVTPANPSIAKGTTQQFTATGTYSNGSTQTLLEGSVTWNSTNTAAATITSAGLATGVAQGSTTIQATSGSISGSTTLTVASSGPVLVSIAVTPANASITQGATQQFTATGTYSDNSTENLTSSVTWNSTNMAAATITSAGLATGVAQGNTTIQANSGSIGGSTTLTVSSLVGWWKFEEGSGSTTADSSGNGNTMSLVNGVSWGAGEVGGAISANGTNQYGTVPAINLSNTSTVTVAFWANRTYSTTVESVMLEDSTNYNNSTTGFGFFPDDTQCLGIQAAVHGNVGYSVNCYSQPSSGVWHHLAIVYDKTQAGNNQTALYIDGVLQTPKSSLEAVQNTNSFGDNPIYLFSRDGSQFFNAGEVSDLRIYNVGLSAAQIQQLYQAGSATLVSIAVTPANPSIAKGTTQQFTATGTYSNGSTQTLLEGSVTWNSTNTAAATITSAGLATGVAQGSTTIQATSGSISGSTTLTVNTASAAPTITSANNTTFAVGSVGTFTVTTTGSPTPALSESGALPNPVTFKDNGNGTATISGTPAAGTGGSYAITITANNGVGTAATQSFTLTVNQAPAITSANSATFAVGTAGNFTVTTTGSPTSALSESGGLPNPVTFKDNGNGTATISGTPATGTNGTYPITITASNGVGTAATQTFTLTVTSGGGGGIKLVQHISIDAGITSSASLAFAANNTLGNWIGVCIRAGQPNETFTIKDSKGNTYHQAVQVNQTADGDTVAIFYAEDVAAGANTITVTDSNADTLRFAILEYSGVATSGSLDVATGSQGSSASPNSGNATTTTSGDLLLGVVMTADSQSFTAGSGFQIEESVPAAPNSKLIVEDQVQANAGSASSSATLSSADPWAAVIAAFKP